MTALDKLKQTLQSYKWNWFGRWSISPHPAIDAANTLIGTFTGGELTPTQKTALAIIFLETYPVKPGTKSYEVWQAIVKEHFVKPDSPNKDADALRISKDLQRLSDKGQLTLEQIDCIDYPDDLLDPIAILPIDNKKVLGNIIAGYYTNWGERRTKNNRPSSAIVAAKAFIDLDSSAFDNAASSTETTGFASPITDSKYKLIMCFFKPTVVKESSISYKAFEKIIKCLFAQEINGTLNATPSEINQRIKKTYKAIVDDIKKPDNQQLIKKQLLIQIGQIIDGTFAPQASKSSIFSCCTFSGIFKSHNYSPVPTSTLSVSDTLSKENLTTIHKKYSLGIPLRNLQVLLTKSIDASFKSIDESVDHESSLTKTFFIHQCLNNNSLISAMKFSSLDFFINVLKDHLVTDYSNFENEEDKLKLLLGNLTTIEINALPDKLRGELFIKCITHHKTPDFMRILKLLIPNTPDSEKRPASIVPEIIALAKKSHLTSAFLPKEKEKIFNDILKTENSYKTPPGSPNRSEILSQTPEVQMKIILTKSLSTIKLPGKEGSEHASATCNSYKTKCQNELMEIILSFPLDKLKLTLELLNSFTNKKSYIPIIDAIQAKGVVTTEYKCGKHYTAIIAQVTRKVQDLEREFEAASVKSTSTDSQPP